MSAGDMLHKYNRRLELTVPSLIHHSARDIGDGFEHILPIWCCGYIDLVSFRHQQCLPVSHVECDCSCTMTMVCRGCWHISTHAGCSLCMRWQCKSIVECTDVARCIILLFLPHQYLVVTVVHSSSVLLCTLQSWIANLGFFLGLV